MGIELDFENNTIRMKEALADGISAALHEIGGELVTQTVRNSRRDTGQTAGSYDYHVRESLIAGQAELQVGSNLENAIWEEFGTGEYALHGNGRKGGWAYEDITGVWHRTRGKKPQRPLFKAFAMKRNTIIRRLNKKIKESVGG